MQIVGNIEGIEQINDKLRALASDAEGKAAKFALLKAAQVVRDAARANAQAVDNPATPEKIFENVSVRFSTKEFRRSGLIRYRVGVLGGARSTSKSAEYSARARRRGGKASLESLGELTGKGKQNPGGDTFYWRYLEFGTEKMKAQPWLRPALEKNPGKIVDTFVLHFGKAVDRALKRQAKARSRK